MDNKLLSMVNITLSKIQKKHFGKAGHHILAQIHWEKHSTLQVGTLKLFCGQLRKKKSFVKCEAHNHYRLLTAVHIIWSHIKLSVPGDTTAPAPPGACSSWLQE